MTEFERRMTELDYVEPKWTAARCLADYFHDAGAERFASGLRLLVEHSLWPRWVSGDVWRWYMKRDWYIFGCRLPLALFKRAQKAEGRLHPLNTMTCTFATFRRAVEAIG